MNNYELLEVSESSSDEEIKEAYRRLLKHYHPDTYEGDKAFAEEKTAELNVAYDAIMAERKNAQNAQEQQKRATEETQEKQETAQEEKKEENQEETNTLREIVKKINKNLKKVKEIITDKINSFKKAQEQEETQVFEQNNDEVVEDKNYYTDKNIENSENNLEGYYKQEKYKYDEKRAKKFLDTMILSLVGFTILLIILFIIL